MSNYVDFERDFPSRCYKLLDEFQFDAEASGHEVTLLLAMSAGMICLVADRIGLAAEFAQQIRSTPFAKPEVKHRWRRLEGVLSTLAHDAQAEASLADIRFCTGVLMSGMRDPDEWPWVPLPAKLTNRQVYSILRNSFAHGNVWTVADGSTTIVHIAFASKLDAPEGHEKRYEALRMTPSTLRDLMRWWIGTVCETEGSRRLQVPTTQKAPPKS